MKKSKKVLAGVLGAVLILGFFVGKGYATLGDWSTEEMWGYNGWHIFAVTYGSWLLYYAVRKRPEEMGDRGRDE